MSAHTEYGDIKSDDDLAYEAIIKQTPAVVREVIDPDTVARRKIAHQQKLEHERKEDEEYGKSYKLALERQERVKEIQYENMTQGRHVGLGHKQVLFTKELECQYCSKPCCFVLDGWNGNKNMMQFSDLTIPYDPSFVDENKNHSRVHECISENSNEMCKILGRQIKGLKRELEDYKQYADSFFRHQAKL
jgi:hypothetical protein